MVSIKVYNQKGSVAGEMEFPKNLETAWNPALVRQVVNAMMANTRKPVADTKGRGEVRGGGKKPWKQKGTGRARQGSIRSPLWKGGGVTFGPTNEKDYSKKINRKMAKKAMLSVLTRKAAEGELKAVESFNQESPKTKLASQLLKRISDSNSILVLTGKVDKNFYLASRNLPKVARTPISNLNVYDLLAHKEVLIEKEALENYGK